jgi:hypothetical protein
MVFIRLSCSRQPKTNGTSGSGRRAAAPVNENKKRMDIVDILNHLSSKDKEDTKQATIVPLRLTHLQGPILMSSLPTLIVQYNNIIDLHINIFQLNVSDQLTQLQHLSYLQRLSITITPSHPEEQRVGHDSHIDLVRPTHIDTPIFYDCGERMTITIPLIKSLTKLIVHTVANDTNKRSGHSPRSSSYVSQSTNHYEWAWYTLILPISFPHLTYLIIEHRASDKMIIKFHEGDNQELSREAFKALIRKKLRKKEKQFLEIDEQTQSGLE